MTALPSRLHRAGSLAASLVAFGLLGARPAGAQVIPEPNDPAGGPSESASAAYYALSITPVGAFAPSADYLLARPGTGPRPMRLHGRFGFMDRGPVLAQRVWGATLDLPVGPAALSITGGYVDVTCDDLTEDPDTPLLIECGGGLTFGARVGSSLFSRSLDAAGTSALIAGTEVTVGWADVDAAEGELFGAPVSASTQALTATIALPVALSVRSGNVTVAPMVAPRFGYGRGEANVGFLGASGEETRAGGRFMLGAGVAVRFADRMGFDAGLQKVFIDQGDTTYGLGVSIGF